MVGSLISGVVQSVAGILALNKSGSDWKYSWLSDPPVISIGARFMYISLLPCKIQVSTLRQFGGKFWPRDLGEYKQFC